MYDESDYDCLMRDKNTLESECNALDKMLDEALSALQDAFALIPKDSADEILAEYPTIERML